MRRRDFLIGCGCAVCAGGAALPRDLLEPHMHFQAAGAAPEVAVTLDACMGETDMRILGPLIAQQVPVTIFATKLWLDNNAVSLKLLLAHPDLFRIENHGALHLAAVIGKEDPYGVKACGTANGVFQEVMGGDQAVTAACGTKPGWYRDATALYTQDAVALIGSMGARIAGFSLNGDIGASLPADEAKARIAGAKSGDVIISHINQPRRSSGAGVIEGLLILKAKGFIFRHLDDVRMVAIA